MKKYIIFCVSVLFVLAVFVFMKCTQKVFFEVSPYHHLTDVLSRDFLIAHAGGGIDGYMYTNSQEAVEKSILKGIKFIEIDLQETSDGFFVGVHDWRMFHEITGYPELGDYVPTFEEFQSRKIYGYYTPIDETYLKKIMNAYPDLVLVTDKTNNFDKIVRTFDFLDRIVVEVFSFKDYYLARQKGIKNPALCVERGAFPFTDDYIKRLFDEGVNMVTLGEDTYLSNLDLLKRLHEKGLTILLYGAPFHRIVNNNDEIKAGEGAYFDYVYTDFCLPDLKCKP